MASTQLDPLSAQQSAKYKEWIIKTYSAGGVAYHLGSRITLEDALAKEEESPNCSLLNLKDAAYVKAYDQLRNRLGIANERGKAFYMDHELTPYEKLLELLQEHEGQGYRVPEVLFEDDAAIVVEHISIETDNGGW